MAFGLANTSQQLPGMNASINTGNVLEEIQTEVLGFLSLNGESKVRLLPSPWPADNPPRPTSSLFSVSSTKGLVAAAGPDSVIIASTSSVRQAFSAGSEADKIKSFTPQLTIPSPRLSHVYFTADGNHLILSAESGGGLAVYETQSLLQGNTQTAFQISTENTAVRALIPNPAAAKAGLVAIILESGQLMVANLSERRINQGENGAVIKDGVSCASWSVKGIQLVAGLGDGTAYQLEPTGAGKAYIPKPPGVGDGWHISSIIWLATDEFLLVHAPTTTTEPQEAAFHYVQTNRERSIFQFSKLPMDPAPPFGLPRLPPTHYFCRLRGWGYLLDTLIVSSVASADTGLITKADVPLSGDVDATRIVNTYTITAFSNDSRRAQLPTSIVDDMADTSPIGMDLDLTATEKAYKPIPGDEIDYSPIPLPAMMLLNQEGVLSAWWVVYNDAVRQRILYPGMAGADASVSSPTSVASPTQSSGFGAFAAPKLQTPAFGSTAFGKPAAAEFGQTGSGAQPAPVSGLGSSTFGSQTQLGAKSSPWGTSTTTQTSGSAFGQPSFGQPAATSKPAFGSTTAFGAAAGTGFGAAGALGQSKSPWGTLQVSTQSDATAKVTPFGGATAAVGPSGFAKLAPTAQSGFGALPTSTSSPFGQTKPPQSAFTATSTPGTSFGMSGMSTPEPSFGSTVTIDSKTDGSTIGSKSIFGSTPAQQSSVFAKPAAGEAVQDDDAMADDGDETPAPEQPKASGGLFGTSDAGFKLGTSFKADSTSKEDTAPKEDAGKSMFGADFSAAVPNKQEPKAPDSKKDEFAPATSHSTVPTKTDEPSTTPAKAAPFTFAAKQQETQKSALQAPEPPEVMSKPASSPAPTASNKSSVEDLDSSPPGPAEQVPAPPSDDEEDSGDFEDESGEVSEGGEDETDEVEEVVDDAPLPPDPNSIKKPTWFHEAIPGAAPSKSDAPRQASALLKQPPPAAPSPPPTKDSPLFKAKTTTPAGFPKAPMTFQPPTTIRESPRSPSPIRSASTPVGRPLVPSLLSASQFRQAPAPRPIVRPSLPPQQEEAPITAASLEDHEDARIRGVLSAPLQATTKLEPFIAHHTYAEPDSKMGLAAAIERVYRDINSMLDNLGLNARSLTAFTKGHEEFAKDAERTREDLDDPESWVLVEVENLIGVEKELEEEVEGARVDDVDDKLDDLAGFRRDLQRWRKELLSVKELLRNLNDPKERKRIREAPLSAELKSEQMKVRDGFAQYQKRLAEAEDAALVVRAKLAGLKGKKDTKAVPTVEAVENTIRKMTKMVEQRSGDVDVLESQMRKLGLARDGTPSRPNSSSVRSSQALGRASAFNTPSPGKGRTFQVPASDDEEEDEEEDPVQREQKKVWAQRVQLYKEKKVRRRAALKKLEEAVHKKATAA